MLSDQPGVGYFESLVLEDRSRDETGTPLFVGFTAQGDAGLYRLQSLQDYEARLGGALVPSDAAMPTPVLYLTVRHYFDNGGRPCFVYSLGGDAALTGLTRDAFLAMLADERIAQAIAGESRIDLLAVPDLVLLDALVRADAGPEVGVVEDMADPWSDGWQRVLELCESRRGVFGLLDAPTSGELAARAAQRFAQRVNGERRAWVAAYWPRLVSDYARDAGAATGVSPPLSARKPLLALGATPARAAQPLPAHMPSVSLRADDSARRLLELDSPSPWVELPPSGAVAAAIGTVDRVRGIWAAPANVQLAHVVKPALRYSDATGLFADDGICVNLIRSFPGRGVKIWGCRTLADGSALDWRYVQVRRFVAYAEVSLAELARFVIFEPNHEITWMKLKGQAVGWLRAAWMQGALAGAQEQDAFRVLVGRDESMTSEDILAGRLIMKVDLAVLAPAEFIRIDLQFRTNEPYTWQRARERASPKANGNAANTPTGNTATGGTAANVTGATAAATTPTGSTAGTSP